MTDAQSERLIIALERIATALEGTHPSRPAAAPPPQPPAAYSDDRLEPFDEPPHPAVAVAPWVCPIHGSRKVVPAGTSKRTGKAYDAFVACPEAGCNQKPPRAA